MGFFWAVLALVVVGSVGAITAMAPHSSLRAEIDAILTFDAIVIPVVLLAVFGITLFDPTKLMLAQISGPEYIENRKLTMGDSTAGARRVPPASGGEPEAGGSEEVS